MDGDSDEMLPEDDSVFLNLSNRPDNVSSDAFMEDSFSEPPLTSTPSASKGKKKVVSPARSASPSRRSRSSSQPASPSQNTISSPSRVTRSSSRAANSSTSSSPSRVTRSTSRGSVSECTSRTASPARATRTSQSATRQMQPPSTSAAARPVQAPSKSSRLKCPKCPSTLANKKTLDTHLRSHLMQGVSSRAPSSDVIQKEIPALVDAVLTDLITEPIIGDTSALCHHYCLDLKKNISEDISGDAAEMLTFLSDCFSNMLKEKKALFPTSIATNVYTETNKLLSSEDFLKAMKGHLSGLCEGEESTINIVLGNFVFLLSKKIVVFTIKTMRGSLSNAPVVRKKRSEDNINDLDFRQLVYHISGSIVHGYLWKGKQYSANSVTWASFCEVLTNKFLRCEDRSNQCSDDIRHHTDQIDRGGLKHPSDVAFDFFLMLFDFVMCLEDENGSLPLTEDIVNKYVLQNDILLCLWDVLVGDDLTEMDALDLLVQITQSCVKVTMKGIMKRRLNENLKQAYDSVALRARLAK